MANENLKNALRSAGLTAEQFAQIIDVDPKTVQRWVSGRTPYPRHRQTTARALELTEHELWPDHTPAPTATASAGRSERPAVGSGEVIGSWGAISDPAAPEPVAFLSNAVDEIDLLDDGRGLTSIPGLINTLLACAREGCQVRLVPYIPTRALAPLIGSDRVQVRVFDAPSGHALIRADDEILLTLTFPGDAQEPRPLLHLRRQGEDGLFDRLLNHYQLLWDHADETLSDPEQLHAYLVNDDELDDDYEDDDNGSTTNDDLPATTGQRSDAVESSGAAPLSLTEEHPPRRWPRRGT